MVQQDWQSANDRKTCLGDIVKLVAAPLESIGIRNALRGAFACETGSTDEFDRLLAKLS